MIILFYFYFYFYEKEIPLVLQKNISNLKLRITTLDIVHADLNLYQ